MNYLTMCYVEKITHKCVKVYIHYTYVPILHTNLFTWYTNAINSMCSS